LNREKKFCCGTRFALTVGCLLCVKSLIVIKKLKYCHQKFKLQYAIQELCYSSIMQFNPSLLEPSTNSLLRGPPRHAQRRKDLSLIRSFNQLSLAKFHPCRSPHHIPIQPSLIESHASLRRQKSDTPIKNLIPREINQRRAQLTGRRKMKINSPPEPLFHWQRRKHTAAVPFRTFFCASNCEGRDEEARAA